MSATVTLIADLILERPLCISCIAMKAGEPSAEALETSLDSIRHRFQLHRHGDSAAPAVPMRSSCPWSARVRDLHG